MKIKRMKQISEDATVIVRFLDKKGYFGLQFLNKDNFRQLLEEEIESAVNIKQGLFKDHDTGEDLSVISLDYRRLGRTQLTGIEIYFNVHLERAGASISTIWLHYGHYHSKMYGTSGENQLSSLPQALAFERECRQAYGTPKNTRMGRAHG